MAKQEERFLKMKSGAVYRYTEALAKRKDAMLVDGFAAAEYYRKLGVENDITQAYPAREIDAGAIPDKPRRPPRNQTKRASKKTAVVVSDEEVPSEDALEELIGTNGEDL